MLDLLGKSQNEKIRRNLIKKPEIKMQKSKSLMNTIPIPNRDTKLVIRLMPVVLCGSDNVLDKKGQLYLRLLCRLVDKAFDEYLSAREYLLEELRSKDKLAYRFTIIGHLENCINALHRAISVFSFSKSHSEIGRFISRNTKRKIQRLNISDIRDAIEHIDKDIQKGLLQKGVFLDIDDEYKNVCIGAKCVSLTEIVHILEKYHELVLEIFNNLPNRYKNGVYYYDKK